MKTKSKFLQASHLIKNKKLYQLDRDHRGIIYTKRQLREYVKDEIDYLIIQEELKYKKLRK